MHHHAPNPAAQPHLSLNAFSVPFLSREERNGGGERPSFQRTVASRNDRLRGGPVAVEQAWKQALLLLIVIASAAVLAACGSAASVSAKRPAVALAQDISRLDRLVVTRTDAFPQNHVRFTFPATVTVTDSTAVQAVARALCALPKMPSDLLGCPADFGITYHLVFSAGDRSFPSVSVDATGCETVRGLGTVRWLSTSPGFWHTLGVAMGLAKPDNATFRGSLSTS